MTIGRRLHYAQLLRRAREEHIVLLSTINRVVRWNETGRRRMLADLEASTLEAIVAALRNLGAEPHEYGRCHECGGEIPTQVLDVAPWAQRCDRHKAAPIS